ncbi:MAG: hypothetical protein HQL72_15475 [Magnetococcales bacterium]|nr:hypothetical protein [Magnetococcales bacterium]
MLNWMLNMVSHPLVPWVLTSLILLWGTLSWLSFRSKVGALLKGLEKATIAIEGSTSSRQFAVGFKKLDKELSQLQDIRVPWSRFRRTLNHTSNQAVQAAQTPETFFTFDAVVLPRLDLRYYQALPGYLIGMGLGFTFISFIVALYFIYRGLSSPDVAIVKESLSSLLNTASLKFSTSIAGLFAGLFFSWGERTAGRQLETQITTLCTLLSDRVVWDVNRETSTQSAEEHEAIRSLVSDSEALKVASHRMDQTLENLNKKVSDLSSRSLDPIIQSVKAEGAQLKEQLQNPAFVAPLIETIQVENRQMTQWLKGEVEQMGEQVGQPPYLADLFTQIQALAAHRQVGETFLQSVAELLKKEGAEQEQLFKKLLNEQHQGYSSQVSLRQVAEGDKTGSEQALVVEQHQMAPLLHAMQQEGKRVAGQMNGLVDSLRQQLGLLVPEQEKSLQKIATETAEQLMQKLSLPSFLNSIREESAQLTQGQLEIISTLERHSESLSDRLDQIALELSEPTEAAERENNALLEGVKEQGDQLIQYLQSQAFMAPVIETVKGETREVSALLRDQLFVDPVIDSIRRETAQISEQISQQAFVAPLIAEMKGLSLKLSADQKAAAQTALSAMVEGMGEPVSRSLQPVLEAVRQEGERVSSAISQMRESLKAEGGPFAEGRELALLEAATQLAAPVDRSAEIEPIIQTVRIEMERSSDLLQQLIDLSQQQRELLESGVLKGKAAELAVEHTNQPAVGQEGSEAIDFSEARAWAEKLVEDSQAEGDASDETPVVESGIETVDVNLQAFAGRNRERYFFGLLTSISSQLRGEKSIVSNGLESTINDLVRFVREGAPISDPREILGLVKLGEQMDQLDFSVAQTGSLQGLDEAFMGLANFLRGFLKTIDVGSDQTSMPPSQEEDRLPVSTTPDPPPPSAASTSKADLPDSAPQSDDLKALMKAFEQHKSRQRPAGSHSNAGQRVAPPAADPSSADEQGGEVAHRPGYRWRGVASAKEVEPVGADEQISLEMATLLKGFKQEPPQQS